MNVLIVADVSPIQRTGGSARVVKEQALGLAGRGHYVQVLCRQAEGPLLSESAMNGVPLTPYDVDRSHAFSYAASSIMGARACFREHFTGREWDWVLFNQPFSALGVQSILPARIRRLYCFYSPAGTEYRLRAVDPRNGKAPVGTPVVAALMERLEHRALARADRVVVLSDFSRRLLSETHGELPARVVSIPGGVDLDHFRPAADREALREELGLPPTKLLILTVRDLEQRMGIDTLLRALRKLPEDEPFQCVIGGTGPLGDFLKDLAAELGLADRVRFPGFIPEDKLPLYYQAADVFVLPSRCHEGFGLVTLEALACATPVIATPAGATPEILGPLDARLLASESGEAALARTLVETLPLIRDESFRRTCRAYVEENYSWDRHVRLLEEELSMTGRRVG